MSALKFLVVDDATFIRDLLKKTLRNTFAGCTIVDTNSAPKAQAALKLQGFDLILCDWEMPDMTGEEFLRWLRADPQHGKTPFIMVSSRGERDYVVKAIQAGADDYIGKPFKPDTLHAKIIKVLKKAGKSINAPSQRASTQGIAFASVDVLTGGATKAAKTASAAPKSVSGRDVQLHFPDFATTCVLKDISLQKFSGTIARTDQVPAVLQTVTVSIVDPAGADVARLNAYVSAVAASQDRIDSDTLYINVRFVDDDANKVALLSRYIGSL